MLDEVKVRERKSAKHGKTYEYRFEIAQVGGERKWISKGGFLSEKEAKKAGLEAWKRYCLCGLPERSSDISFADFLDDWMENDCKYNLKEGLQLRPLLLQSVLPSPAGLQSWWSFRSQT